MKQFAEHYQGKKPSLADLRLSYDLLMMKVLSLLQDKDQTLASEVVSSREAIGAWQTATVVAGPWPLRHVVNVIVARSRVMRLCRIAHPTAYDRYLCRTAQTSQSIVTTLSR